MTGKKFLNPKPSLHLLPLILIFLIPFVISCQTVNSQKIHLDNSALRNYQDNLKSNNDGIVRSSIFFAGKYKLSEVAPDILEILKNSKDEDLCKWAVWSIYEIGDDQCCNELQKILQDHPSKKIKEFCNFLRNIKDYEKELTLSSMK